MHTNEANLGGSKKTLNRQGLYSKVEKHADIAIQTLIDLMTNSKNDTVRVSAAKCILDKCLPNIKESVLTSLSESIRLQNYNDFIEKEKSEFII